MDIVIALRAHANNADKVNALFDRDIARRAADEIEALRTLAREAYAAWDTDMDSKIGKLLHAMLYEGFRKTYRPDLPPNYSSTER
jgi:hypothetical protein